MRLLLQVIGLALCASLALTGAASAVDVNNFRISNYDIEMKLSTDDQQRSTLRATETITAVFPDLDQNRGIERAIPTKYDGHSVSLDIVSVTKPDGTAWNYSTYNDGGNRVVRVGDADRYVRGAQTYVITYEQRDVTKYFEDTDRDEFYWDTNGTNWRVPIDNLSVNLVIDDSIRSAATGDTACYQGAQLSSDRCSVQSTSDGYVANASNLAPGENLTLAVGFEPETFAAYQMSLMEKLFLAWGIVQLILIPVAISLTVWVVLRFVRITSRSREMGTIVAEYLPPKEVSVTASAKIAKGVHGSVMAAQLIDLAVRHYLKLTETQSHTLLGKKPRYRIEIIKPIGDLMDEEKELLTDMFGHEPEVGEKLSLETLQNNSAYYQRTTDNDKKLRQLVVERYGLKVVDEKLKKWLRRVAGWVFLVSVLTLSPFLPIVSLIAFVLSFNARTLTDKGLALRRYLAGLKDYIKVGEAERLKMLQSPEGAEKVSDLAADVNDASQRVVLYERVLPYAILFHQEKEWSKQLGQYYEQVGQEPEWYTGRTAFNAAAFSSALGSFTSSTSSYGGASSSSSGGSSGGGFSGGGGGGGGGGGW